ncbi:MAG TPA: KH domain-containing protein [Candidatus Nanoarchaeia archaeon]|nr:KH domain-containing protein [Candidatus Nanoarchaeia archaeon]
MTEYLYELRIPKDRIAVLIGKEGKIKSEIEAETQTTIKVDSKEGDIFITGEEALGLYSSREVIRAIGRGFNPEVAKLLLKGDYAFELIDLRDYVGKSKDHLLRIKGRIIGAEGKTRRLIEELTGAHICVYGKTAGVIGEPTAASNAREAIEKLLRGSPHSTVYKFLEKKRTMMKRERMLRADLE